MKRITFQLESRLEATHVLGKMVNLVCSSAGLSAMDASLVEVSVIEAVNNAIEHAYESDPGHMVEVDVTLSPEALTFDVYDSGQAADPEWIHADHQKALDLHVERLGEAPERGRGLAIIQHVMDTVEYTPGGERNRFRLIKRLNGE